MALQCSVASYNMHGFRQGLPCLIDLCSTYDIVFVQEHWLSTPDLHLLNVRAEHIVSLSSAMDDAVARGVLRGRPFGGVAIFVRKV